MKERIEKLLAQQPGATKVSIPMRSYPEAEITQLEIENLFENLRCIIIDQGWVTDLILIKQ